MLKIEFQLENLKKVRTRNESKTHQLESMIEELNSQSKKIVVVIQRELKLYAAELCGRMKHIRPSSTQEKSFMQLIQWHQS